MIRSILMIVGLLTMLVMAEPYYNKFMDSDLAEQLKDSIEKIEDRLD